MNVASKKYIFNDFDNRLLGENMYILLKGGTYANHGHNRDQ